jgi:hypothetical protein
MKPLLLIPIVCLGACVSREPRTVPVISTPPSSRAASAVGLRTPEQLREYRFGRYADPGDPLTMHEGHPVFRVETSAAWDLRPGGKAVPSYRTSTGQATLSANDAVVAEVNRQRVATRAFTEQTATLNQRISEMTEATVQTRELAKQTAVLSREMATLRQRLDAADARRRELKTTPEERSKIAPEDKW